MASRNYDNYSLENFERPEDQMKGRIGAGVFLAAVLLLLFIPWFTTTYPIPEAEGLMASFGDVEIAGGGGEVAEEVQEEQEETTTEQATDPVEEVVEEVETAPSEDAPAVVAEPERSEPKPEAKPTPAPPKPRVNDNALFPGSGGGGNGSGNGPGQQGRPDGRDDLGGTGRGDRGTGSGEIGTRRNIRKCEDYQTGNTAWDEKGKAVITICVDERGKVTSAKINRRKSTITDLGVIRLMEGCARQYRYEAAPGKGEACGDITIDLNVR